MLAPPRYVPKLYSDCQDHLRKARTGIEYLKSVTADVDANEPAELDILKKNIGIVKGSVASLKKVDLYGEYC